MFPNMMIIESSFELISYLVLTWISRILHMSCGVIIPTGQRTKSVFLDCSEMPEIDFTIVQVRLTFYTLYFLWGKFTCSSRV